MNRLLVPKAFGITFTVVAVTTFYSVHVCPLQASVPFCRLKWLLLPPSVSPSPSPPACLPSWPLWYCWCFLPLCCWFWPVLLLGLSEQAQQTLFSLIWCLARSPSVLHQLGTGDVNTTPLAASSTDISSRAKHVSVTPNLACQSLLPPLIQLRQREWEIVAKILYCVQREIDSAINKAIASK